MSEATTTIIDGSAGAQTLVLLESAGAGSASWNAIAGALSEQFRVVRPLRGAAPAIAALGAEVLAALDALGCRRAHIAGSGIGATIALWLAVHHPDRVARIAVLGAGAQAAEPAAWLTEDLATRDTALAASLGAAYAATADVAKLRELQAATDLTPDLGRIATPTLVIAGADDATFDAKFTDALLTGLAQAKLERIPKAAHLVAVEQPARTAKLLLDHFGSAASLETGFISRRMALGDPHVDKTIAAITPFTRPFQDFLTRYCWGEVWTRSGLSRRDRSLATISVLVAIGAEHEIPVHVRAGLRHGLQISELQELYEQLALYTGLPRAFGALNITQKTLIEDGLLDATPAP